MNIKDFKDIFTSILAPTSTSNIVSKTLYATLIDTALGSMLAIADEKHLYFLEFTDWRHIRREILRLRAETNAVILLGNPKPLKLIKTELQQYFQGKLKQFKTPLNYLGTPFQVQVWKTLTKIPYSKTRSYADVAALVGKPSAYRAVANANGVNKMVVVIPCHRVINHNGSLGGYGGGLERKQWLLDLESSSLR